ncbi:MAG TPA: 5-deoxy-glucuronate isomerase [bacterium]|nr:5-deoxy-glucuronate isomerase [bacterium]HOL34787.1 5-deoxy-glucuronate isomerase [bacterium]HPP07754.1 5-deoxy-glucuronate isomerase [bacterium]
MSMRFSISKRHGFEKKIVSPRNSDLKFLSFSYLFSMFSLQFEQNTEDEEWLWVIMSGKINITIGESSFCMERKGVFNDRPVSLYIPAGTKYVVKSEGFSEAVAVSAPSGKNFSPVFISSDGIEVQRAGKLNYQRSIFNIMPQDFPASKIIAGETIHDTGHWSCFPPHKHDEDRMPEESKHEELYFFKCEPEKTGFGLMRVYDDTQDVAFPILPNDVITIPKGYHPVSVIPGHKLYYFWALAGEKRPFQRHTHPDYLKYE